MKVSENCRKELFHLSHEQISNSTVAQNIWKNNVYQLKGHNASFREVLRDCILGMLVPSVFVQWTKNLTILVKQESTCKCPTTLSKVTELSFKNW